MFQSIKTAFRGSNAASSSPPKRASLLGLPQELREKIWALSIPSHGTVEPEPQGNCTINVRGGDDAISEFVLLPPLAQASRQLREECAAYFLGNNTFMVEFNRYHRTWGLWLWKVEPLWCLLREVVLQLDMPAVRERKANGTMLQAMVKCEEGGRFVRLYSNLTLGEHDKHDVAGTLLKMIGETDVLDGRHVVWVVKWLLANTFTGERQPGEARDKSEWDAKAIVQAA